MIGVVDVINIGGQSWMRDEPMRSLFTTSRVPTGAKIARTSHEESVEYRA
jgi:hypothetical protein